jgi:hypothetical protein
MSTVKSSSEDLTLNADGSGNDVVIQSNGTTKAIVTAEGNVGIGTVSPSQPLHVVGGAVRFQNTQDTYFQINTSDTHLYTAGSHPLRFGSNSAERMRISSGGEVLVGKTSVYSNGSIGAAVLQWGGEVGARAGAVSNQNSTAAVVGIGFANPNGHCGAISTSGTSTIYATSSDYRLKENNTPITNATERVKQLNPIRFNFIKDPDTTVDGFLAHEVAEVVPEAVSGEKDATAEVNIYDEDNNVIGTETEIVPQGIDQAKLVPLLVATIQELEARITALEAANGS